MDRPREGVCSKTHQSKYTHTWLTDCYVPNSTNKLQVEVSMQLVMILSCVSWSIQIIPKTPTMQECVRLTRQQFKHVVLMHNNSMSCQFLITNNKHLLDNTTALIDQKTFVTGMSLHGQVNTAIGQVVVRSLYIYWTPLKTIQQCQQRSPLLRTNTILYVLLQQLLPLHTYLTSDKLVLSQKANAMNNYSTKTDSREVLLNWETMLHHHWAPETN